MQPGIELKSKAGADHWPLEHDIMDKAIVLIVNVQVAVSDLGRGPVVEVVAQAAIKLKSVVRDEAKSAIGTTTSRSSIHTSPLTPEARPDRNVVAPAYARERPLSR